MPAPCVFCENQSGQPGPTVSSQLSSCPGRVVEALSTRWRGSLAGDARFLLAPAWCESGRVVGDSGLGVLSSGMVGDGSHWPVRRSLAASWRGAAALVRRGGAAASWVAASRRWVLARPSAMRSPAASSMIVARASMPGSVMPSVRRACSTWPGWEWMVAAAAARWRRPGGPGGVLTGGLLRGWR